MGWFGRLGMAVAFVFASVSAHAETTLTWGKPQEMTTLDPQISGDGTSCTVWGRQLGAVKEVVAVHDETVRFELSQPLTALLSILAVAPTSIVPIAEIEDGSFDPTKTMMGS